MSRKSLIILTIILQLAILASFAGRYEVLKQTATAVYIPVTGYDPTDLLRGDYVNLSYELSVLGKDTRECWLRSESYLASGEDPGECRYIVPTMSGSSVTGISHISGNRPIADIYFDAGSTINSIYSRQEGSQNKQKYSFQIAGASRFFVREGTGLDLEQKIRDSEMYAEWRVIGNGKIILTNILSKEDISK